MLATELSDLLYAIFLLAEHYNIALEEAFQRLLGATYPGLQNKFKKCHGCLGRGLETIFGCQRQDLIHRHELKSF